MEQNLALVAYSNGILQYSLV